MKRILLIIFFFGFAIFQNISIAQQINVTEQQVRNELDKRGLSEEEVRQALIDNNINPDELDKATPEQILQIKQIIEELEQKKLDEEIKQTEKKDSVVKNINPPDIPTNNLKVKEDQSLEKIDSFPVYGHNILSIPPEKNEDLTNVNEYYVLGTGDKISISIWSDNSHFDNSYIIDKNGYIKIKMRNFNKRIYLKGLPLFKARKKINNELSHYIIFNPGEINIDLESSRNIKISVYGEVLNPGSFSINTTNTVFEAVKYANGTTPIASVRNIKLIHSSGKFKVFDLYKYLIDPKYGNNFFLDNNDMIHVPVADKIVTVKGGVKRPMSYELVEGEGLRELINYAGGFNKDAIQQEIRINRYVENKKNILTIDYIDKKGKISDFILKDGDEIIVNVIKTKIENYYEIKGAVYNPGRFERKDGIRVSSALKLSGLKPVAKTDFAFLLRTDENGVKRYIKMNIDEILKNENNDDIDFLLRNKDVITIWPKTRFTDKAYIKITGAVRDTGTYLYGIAESIKISDAIVLAGGLNRNASNIAFIHRQDPLRKFEKQYIKVDLGKILLDPGTQENIKLKPFDNLEVLSQNLFNEKRSVNISGAVNNPGIFQYGKNMTLKDLILLAGGFKMAASTNNIEVSRIEIQNNKPTRVIVGKINVDKNSLMSNNNTNQYLLEPYDNVFVRYVPDFELQKIVTLTGEVRYPGNYTIAEKNEKISDLINRAGGFSEEAFLDGATLYRSLDSTGYIVMGLKDAMEHYKSKYNYIIKSGDIIFIPKQKDFVTIRGATNVYEKYKDEVAFNKHGINVPYHKGKRAIYYINKYAGGINENGDRNNILVKHPNGEIEKTNNLILFKLTPKVRKGSIIEVGYKQKNQDQKKKKKDIDWNKIITDSVAQISTIMTLVILFKSLSQ